MAEAKRHPNTSKFFTGLGEVHGVPQAVVDRASPTLFRAVLKATAVSGIVNVNYKVRSDRTPAIFEMIFGRPTGDLVAAPRHRCKILARVRPPRRGVSTGLRGPARRGGRHRRCRGTFRVFVKEAAVARSKGYSESRFDSYVEPTRAPSDSRGGGGRWGGGRRGAGERDPSDF